MKKILLFSLAFFTLVSCSDDDADTGDNQVHLSQITQHINSLGQPAGRVVTNLDNGRPYETDYFYDGGSVPQHHTVYNYNGGLLTSTVTYSEAGTEAARTDYTYDNQRITKVLVKEGNFTSETSYTFNSNNTITATTVSGGGTSVKTFHLNNSGIIYKEVGNFTYELTFNGLNPVSAQNSNGNVTTFTYDEEHNPALMNTVNIYGSYKPNAVLRARYLMDVATNTATKFLIQEKTGSDIRKHDYTFNGDGRPVYRKDIYNNEIVSETEYTYE
jgi:hypothetical protein